jgi:CheY-like chemotaxis protein
MQAQRVSELVERRHEGGACSGIQRGRGRVIEVRLVHDEGSGGRRTRSMIGLGHGSKVSPRDRRASERGGSGGVGSIRRVKVLLVSPDPASRETMRVVVRSIERVIGSPIEFLEGSNGGEGVRIGLRERPDAIVADEFASREGAFSMARSLRGDPEPYAGAIVILLERKQDEWLARWSGADAWSVKPVDPFDLADRLVELLERMSDKETA